MYRNIFYSSNKGEITEFHWDENGERVKTVSKFEPYLFVETDRKTKWKTIYGTYSEPKKFKNTWERHKYVDNEDNRIFYNLPPEQQYAINKYNSTPKEDFVKNPIRTFFLDIECPSPDEFPHASEAKYEINLLTIYDSLTKTYYMWGSKEWDHSNYKEKLKDFKGKFKMPENIEYFHIEDEKKRLKHLLKWWSENCPDILSHWNGKSFDIPYLVNRMKILLGKNDFKKLSPINYVSNKDDFDKFGNPEIRVNIHAVNDMDYMDVFKTFTFNQEQESWSLDNIASKILECGKLEYDQGDLWKLSQEDWDTYAAYNLVDVALLVSLEEELEFLQVGRETAYEGFSNIVDCLGKVKTITGYISASTLKEGKLVETKGKVPNQKFEGGFVLAPQVGISTNVVSYDVTSLYPSIMMSLNTSHETKIGTKEGKILRLVNGTNREYDSEESLDEWISSKGYCISGANIIFDQSFNGVVTKFIREQFDNKSKFGKMAKESQANGDYELAKVYDRKRAITKIFANSGYGILSTGSSPFYDIDIARSITLTGQNVIKKAHELIENLSNKKFETEKRVVVASDTDSAMIDLTEVCNKLNINMFDEEGKLTKNGDKLCGLYNELLNTKVNDWARDKMFCKNPSFFFEREKCASAALFFGKKQYAYYVNNNEGFDLPPEKRMKYTGLKVIKSEYSPMVKKMMNELYHDSLANYEKLGNKETRDLLADIVKRHKKEFLSSEFIDASKRQKANGLTKFDIIDKDGKVDLSKAYPDRPKQFYGDKKKLWERKVRAIKEDYKKNPLAIYPMRTPVQVKACLNHNRLVENLGLKSRYPLHSGGVKAMWVYLKPNKWGFDSMAGNNGILPPEFELEIDYEKQFDKLYMNVYEQLFDTIGWRKVNLNFEEAVDLYELFT